MMEMALFIMCVQPIDNSDPNRCERATLGNNIGQVCHRNDRPTKPLNFTDVLCHFHSLNSNRHRCDTKAFTGFHSTIISITAVIVDHQLPSFSFPDSSHCPFPRISSSKALSLLPRQSSDRSLIASLILMTKREVLSLLDCLANAHPLYIIHDQSLAAVHCSHTSVLSNNLFHTFHIL